MQVVAGHQHRHNIQVRRRVNNALMHSVQTERRVRIEMCTITI
jgi:hypothetical protein